MTASNGLFELKVDENEEQLIELLKTHESINNVNKEEEVLIATLDKEMSASEMNAFLFKNGITLSHLVKRKPSLEQQFLKLTSNN